MDCCIGEIRMFAGPYAPAGWAFCNGAILPILNHEVLYSLIGNRYGGDGLSTFALPDLRGRAPIHYGAGVELGERSGAESVPLQPMHFPAHSHTIAAATEASTTSAAGGALLGSVAGAEAYRAMTPTVPLATDAIGPATPAGSGQPHENMQPFLAISFIIALEGLYPSRD